MKEFLCSLCTEGFDNKRGLLVHRGKRHKINNLSKRWAKNFLTRFAQKHLPNRYPEFRSFTDK